MIKRIRVQGYRSLREIDLPLRRLTVVTGPNGSGKSNLYRTLWLISRICEGSFGKALAQEGGLVSALWAGPRLNAKKPVRMTIGFQLDDLSFELSCGFPAPANSFFSYDPNIKEEAVWTGPIRRPSTTLLERSTGNATIQDVDGTRVEYPLLIDPNESILGELREPHRYPELFKLREAVRGWRFYHDFNTNDDAPLRRARIAVRTPVLSHDGSDLAAALQTILEVGDGRTLLKAISAALPGRSLNILTSGEQSISSRAIELMIGLDTEGCRRPLLANELSDGTLKFLCLAAALLSPRPPELIALNEPETSLHPDLLHPLAGLIVDATKFSQVWVTTHSTVLAEAIARRANIQPIELALHHGETIIASPPDSP